MRALKRSQVERLGEIVWAKPLVGLDLEVALVPAEAAAVIDHFGVSLSPEQKVRRVCSTAFVDFRGYEEDDGTPVQNGYEARAQLYRLAHVQLAVDGLLLEHSRRILQGEADVASGSFALASRS